MNFGKWKINQHTYIGIYIKKEKSRETPSLNKNSISQQKFSFPDILICDCANCADKYGSKKLVVSSSLTRAGIAKIFISYSFALA